jgi:N-acetylgalactosamine kinase
VVLFGLSEMARAQRCLDLLKQNDARSLGQLMTVSHNGDRVSRAPSSRLSPRASKSTEDQRLADWGGKKAGRADLAAFSGNYGCSLPAIDRIVDFARGCPGVEGAQLAGAGLGGCVMVLVQRPHTAGLLKALAEQGIRGEVFRPIAGACSLILS